MCWPLLASSGATPASEANAASLLTRPGWDQLMSSWAATTGPTPGYTFELLERVGFADMELPVCATSPRPAAGSYRRRCSATLDSAAGVAGIFL